MSIPTFGEKINNGEELIMREIHREREQDELTRQGMTNAELTRERAEQLPERVREFIQEVLDDPNRREILLRLIEQEAQEKGGVRE